MPTMKLRGLYRKTDSRIWYFQPPQVKGVRPPPVSLGTRDEKIATEKYWKLRARADRELTAGTIRLELARYLETRQKGRRHETGTTRETERILTALRTFAGKTQVKDYTHDVLRRWQISLENRGLEASTMRTYFNRVRGFFTWAKNENLLYENPVDRLSLPTAVKTRSERYCTREERDKLIAHCPKERDDLALFLWLGFFAGLRPKEIIEARPDWLDLNAGVLTVRNTPTFTVKDKAHRLIRLSGRLGEYLASCDFQGDYLLRPDKKPGKKVRNRKKQAWRYRYDPRRPFKEYVATQGLAWVTPHTMRHTWATLHALAGTPLAVIAGEMGDELTTVTKNYIGYARNAEGHASAID